MLLLFTSIYFSMFYGSWYMLSWSNIVDRVTPVLNGLGTFLTSIFGDNVSYDALGDILIGNSMFNSMITLLAFVLALITSIGIVVMAVKGVKKAFGIFFMGIRR